MPDDAKPQAMAVNPAPAPRKKPGPPKGVRYGGKKKGSKNKATLERERKAQLALEQARLLEQGNAEGIAEPALEAVISGRKLMKEIAFEFAMKFAGIAAYYQPHPNWRQVVDAEGKPVVDAAGRPVMINANPVYNESMFYKYADAATRTALGAAAYESPRLAAVLLAQDRVEEIELIGGLPDDQDGGFHAADGGDKAGTDAGAEPGAGGAGDPPAGENQSAGANPDVPPVTGGAVPDAGQAEGGPVRKAVG